MYSLLFLALAAFVLSLFLTPLVRNVALRLGFVDQPDGSRKLHRGPIPRVGGIAILLASLGAYGLLLLIRLTAGHIVLDGVPFALRLLPAVLLIFGVGLMDDVFNLRAWHKLTAQIIAAVLAWGSGIHLGAIGGHPLSAPFSFLLTIAWIVACCNAVNLIDGVDGLATGVGLFATITTLIAALLHHNIDLAFATVPLAGALLGFLRYNFNPASVFLGDCGSLTLGFLLGCYGIVWSEKSTTLFSIAAPLLALSVPLIDAGVAILRRFLRQQPIFGADRAHIHHKLLSRGLTPRRVVFVLYGFCGLAAAAALMLSETREKYHGFVIVVVFLAVLLGLRHLGYTEFSLAGKLALNGSFQRQLNAQLALLGFEEEIATCMAIEDFSQVLSTSCLKFGFSGVEMDLDGLVFQRVTGRGWRVRIDFPGHGYINLTRDPDATNRGAEAVLFIDAVHRAFDSKLNELQAIPRELAPYAHSD
jgi:UDP-GlcNAc:undecaprenyl-phosphate GlcNAc-1-phosphate transferase